MKKLNQKLYITYSNQRVRDLKANQKIVSPIDKVITLDMFISETFERKNLETVIDEIVASSIIYKIIEDENIEYFSYLESDANSLNYIYDFIVKCNRNEVSFDTLLSDKKLKAIKNIDKAYQNYKADNNLVDISDVENIVLNTIENKGVCLNSEIFLDSFVVEDISFIRSKKQSEILDKLSKYKKIEQIDNEISRPKLIIPSNEVFDNIDEVKTAIKIARKLLEEGASENEILIVSTDIGEYAPLYKLFLDEYEMKGYSSVGSSLSHFFDIKNIKVKAAINSYNSKVESLQLLFDKLGLSMADKIKDNIRSDIKIVDEKIGIELTEANQLIGMTRKYKHMIFIGTDINHFPPKANDNFLYSNENELEYFYANNYFTTSQTQYNELKRLCTNLYIITAKYCGKRELIPSIIIDKKFDGTIDVSSVKSKNDLAFDGQAKLPSYKNTQEYYESISSQDFTSYDGKEVTDIQATHLSASQINKYLSCPLAYLYSNKVRVQAPKQSEDGFDVMDQGSLMHLCYEYFGKQIQSNAQKEDAVENFDYKKMMYEISFEAYKDFMKEKNIDDNIHHRIFLTNLQAGLQDDRSAGLLIKFVEYYIEKKVEFESFKNSEFEKEFALDSELKPIKLKDKDDKNYFIKGFIDRFDNLSEFINIIDYKSKKMISTIDTDKQAQIKELKDVQLALYILYASQEYPNKEYHSSLLSFKGEKPYYHFAKLSNVDNIKNTEFYSDDYEKDLKQLIFDTKDNIENGKFSFNSSDEKMCGYCDIKYMCHESVLNKKRI